MEMKPERRAPDAAPRVVPPVAVDALVPVLGGPLEFTADMGHDAAAPTL